MFTRRHLKYKTDAQECFIARAWKADQVIDLECPSEKANRKSRGICTDIPAEGNGGIGRKHEMLWAWCTVVLKELP